VAFVVITSFVGVSCLASSVGVLGLTFGQQGAITACGLGVSIKLNSIVIAWTS